MVKAADAERSRPEEAREPGPPGGPAVRVRRPGTPAVSARPPGQERTRRPTRLTRLTRRRARQTRRRARPPRPGRPLAWAAAATLTGLALFACYLRQSRTVAVGSDGASQALQAWDLVHGNPLLHGWWVTDVSFYTTELPQYALIELARGLNADVIHVAGALSYALLLTAAALLARGRQPGPAGWARALLTAGIVLAPQPGAGTQTLVLSPDHTGTCVPVLLVLLLIDSWLGGDRGPGPRAAARWYVPALVWLGLTWTAVADALTLFIAVIPIALAGAAWAVMPWLMTGRRTAAGPAADVTAVRSGEMTAPAAQGRRARGAAAALAVAALLAVPAELAVTGLIRAHGGWQVNGLRTALAGAGQLAGNARLTGQGLLELFGADVIGASGVLATALAAVHLASVAVAAAGVLAAARGFFRRADLVEQVLLIGIAVDLAAYLAGVQAVNILSTREIGPVLPFAAVLAGRFLGARFLGGGRFRGQSLGPPAITGAVRPAAAAAIAVLALYTAGLGYAAAQPPAAPQYADLAGWLRAHHLTAGLSGYHQANIVTLASGGAVTLRPLTTAPGGRLAAYTWNASSAWFDPARHRATFVVLLAPGTPGASGLTAARAAATFGRPARTYRYRAYAILVWPGGQNLLASLGQTSPDGRPSGAAAAPKERQKQGQQQPARH